MRSLRLLLSLLASAIVITCLLSLSPISGSDNKNVADRSLQRHDAVSSWLSFRNPISFFAPTATIGLTDDNSTFFAARPAAFGPLLPARGLSGQVWIGSGFLGASLGRGGVAVEFEGELGCNDIPGWINHHRKPDHGPPSSHHTKSQAPEKAPRSHQEQDQLAEDKSGPVGIRTTKTTTFDTVSEVDGTDDFLHYPLPTTSVGKPHPSRKTTGNVLLPEHINFRPSQDESEIEGKIVLLSRGGCGFAEKIKWAQRRGGIAVIVGDNIPGGPLLRMYANGDTSNITIPSLFTAHTTARLLSSLIPSGLDEGGSAGIRASPDRDVLTASGKDSGEDIKLKAKATTQASEPNLDTAEDPITTGHGQAGWLKAHLRGKSEQSGKGSVRPPSSGSLMWRRVEDFDEEDKVWKAQRHSHPSAASRSNDGFVIGVQDWRDPDVVMLAEDTLIVSSSSSTKSSVKAGNVAPKTTQSFRGGSITPGSGEYVHTHGTDGSKLDSGASQTSQKSGEDDMDESDGWLNHIWGSSSEEKGHMAEKASSRNSLQRESTDEHEPPNNHKHPKDTPPTTHLGLWVTLTPTDMNTTPFFHTLFVLIVSPLITLAIVYTMLLLRSRIRRRRWRAPKSVVQQLPVRIFHAFSSRSSSTALDNIAEASSPTTPLLAESRAASASSRPRSRTICGSAASAASVSSTSRYGSVESTSSEQEKESGLSEWRRQYRGKQLECVVCLEEYVDGVSRIMSLPCGHEFHVDCITPWLMTRRRTCPICKGDVVKSMGRQAQRAARAVDSEDDLPELTADDIQREVAETSNESSTSALPIPRGEHAAQVDIETGNRRLPSAMARASPISASIARNFRSGLEYMGLSPAREQGRRHERSDVDRNR